MSWPCVVKAVKATGARVAVEDACPALPATIELTTIGYNRDVLCKVVDRNGDELDIRFLSDPGDYSLLLPTGEDGGEWFTRTI